jgi:glutamate 5-kinase
LQPDQNLEAERKRRLRSARRLVVKLGTSTVTGADGDLCAERVEPIVRSIAALAKSKRQVVLVSSGAVGLGRAWLGLHASRLGDMVTKQACAAVGQSLLMDAYKRLFAECGLKVAQVLLTEEDFTVWRRYSNLRHTIEKLLQFGVIPIINENDTVSTAELTATNAGKRVAFSDNDRLAALVMSGLEADALVLLTNVPGFLRGKMPADVCGGEAGDNADSGVIPLLSEITPELKALAAGPSGGGRGGMSTKLDAAEVAMHCGGVAVIANGQTPRILERILDGERIGTAFVPSKRMRGKRRWIAFAANVQGRMAVDSGARRALEQGKASLLASGVVRIESHFATRDVVSIVDAAGKEFARGIAACSSHEAETSLDLGKAARGAASRAASRVVVRRDNIVLL